MTDKLQKDLTSALYNLSNRFSGQTELLHEAVAVVFSSIFRKYSIQCIIVGGQAAAFWMRMPGSVDVDFVSADSTRIAYLLERCGFKRSDDFAFRYRHTETDVLVELVGESIRIEGVKKVETVEIAPDDIDELSVKSLMQGTAETLDPLLVFLNYLEISTKESIWYDYSSHGSLAIERAQALLTLYEKHIISGIISLLHSDEIDDNLVRVVREKFNVEI